MSIPSAEEFMAVFTRGKETRKKKELEMTDPVRVIINGREYSGCYIVSPGLSKENGEETVVVHWSGRGERGEPDNTPINWIFRVAGYKKDEGGLPIFTEKELVLEKKAA